MTCQHGDATAWRCVDCSAVLADEVSAGHTTAPHRWQCECGAGQTYGSTGARCVSSRHASTVERLAARRQARDRALAGASPFVARFDALPAVGSAAKARRRMAMRSR